MHASILVVDDEADICDLVCDILEDEGYSTSKAKNSTQAFERMAEAIPTAMVLDIWLKDSELDGLGILEAAHRKYPHMPIIMISGHGNIDTAINSLRMGAYDYIEKPFKPDRLLHTLDKAIENVKLRQENDELRLRTQSPNIMIGESAVIVNLKQQIDKVAPTNSRVFITGPGGAGKEVVARMIHQRSSRGNKPFVCLNAATLGTDMADIELFGTEESEDLNAPPRKVGVFEQATGGTLYIDEICDIPLEVQAKFVRFLQDGTFTRVGGSKKQKSDVRVVVSSSRNVQQHIEDGKLREDLFYRLHVVPLTMPSLNERREDIPMLCDYFLAQAAEASNQPKRQLSEDAVAALQAYSWPGNVRQLRNVIEWVLIMANAEENQPISSDMLPKDVFSSGTDSGAEMDRNILSMKLREAREVFEKHYLTSQINRFSGNISRTANFIGMERSALHRKLKLLSVPTRGDEKMADNDEDEDTTIISLEQRKIG